MADIAVGTKVFTRTKKLQQLLDSIEQTDIDRVYIADDGKRTPEKERVYEREYDFELDVIELEYDAGLGRGRKEIVDRLQDETYLLIVDTDHEVPPNVSVLADQLAADPSIGGIAGTIVEPEHGRVFQSAKDFREEGEVLVRSADLQTKRIESIAGYPFTEFDFIPNAAMFRTACLDDYCWDPNYVIGKEHIDFYVGHWKQTDWRFGVCPSVCFNHFPGGDTTYETNRNSREKLEQSERYFQKKWGYEAVRSDRSYWFDTEPIRVETFVDRAKRVYSEDGFSGLVRKSAVVAPRMLKNILREKWMRF
jgi:GT2 family glycosyltransferase